MLPLGLFIEITSYLRRIYLKKYFRHQDTKIGCAVQRSGLKNIYPVFYRRHSGFIVFITPFHPVGEAGYFNSCQLP
jgi:hypothetical protein